MANKKLLTALYEKMAAAQAQYRQWLRGQSPGESLNHARGKARKQGAR